MAQQDGAGDSLYRWQWQAGRIHKASGRIADAALSYQQAIATLQTIRSDIVLADKDLQFEVRDEVEPVYRDLMTLLLEGSQDKPSNVKEALDLADLLYLTELQSFFGDECLEVSGAIVQNSASLAKSNAAVINSIVLARKTYMVLHLPDGKLKSYPVALTAEQLQSEVKRFRFALENIETDEYLSLSQKLYGLLIQPIGSRYSCCQTRCLSFY